MGEKILKSLIKHKDWQEFWHNQKSHLIISEMGEISPLPKDFALLPGSFNPLHEGHQKLAQITENLLKKPVIFELSIANVDKPWLDEITVLKRISQFIGYKPIVITKAAKFLEKTKIFNGCSYVLGYDTAIRVFSPKYYTNEQEMIDSLKVITQQGGQFLVACRLQNNIVKTLADIAIPTELQPFFSEIPAELFRVDISSTQIRSQDTIL